MIVLEHAGYYHWWRKVRRCLNNWDTHVVGGAEQVANQLLKTLA
jgi:hypothetical protein